MCVGTSPVSGNDIIISRMSSDYFGLLCIVGGEYKPQKNCDANPIAENKHANFLKLAWQFVVLYGPIGPLPYSTQNFSL